MSLLRKTSITVGVLFVLVIVAGVLYLKPQTDVGTGYVAKQVCSCVYLGERDYEQCRLDQPDFMDPIDAEHIPELEGVKASYFPLSEATAYYFDGYGCILD
ncbi:MAG: hypothetical protein OES38_12455 [Gammaproteobacteria bacterium]|nr:hypothetical protein [Gammaproteobacteria bacterium]